MESGLQIVGIVVFVVGVAGIVIYQWWKKNSRTQAELDARRKDDQVSE